MTATAHISDRQPSALAPLRVSAVSVSRDWVVWGVAVGILLTMYLLLQNPYWVPGGDSEAYTSTARNLLIGKGYTFNGQPVCMYPPGWPWFLAAAMTISPTFLLLKLLTMACMLGSLAIAYWICRRYVSPGLSALAVVLAGTLYHVYTLTFWLHSDALFCLLSMAALLVAFQINEGRSETWRCVLLVTLCVASIVVRWAGLLTWVMAAAVLVRGDLLPKIDRRWITAAVGGALTLGTFAGIRVALSVSPDVQQKIRDFGGMTEGTEQPMVPTADATVSKTYDIWTPNQNGWKGQIGRAIGWGDWLGWLLWHPLRAGRSNTLVGIVGRLIGWAVLALIIVQGARAFRVRDWFWPALIGYSLLLALNWGQPNARYLVPIAPLLILGVFQGVLALRERMAGSPHAVLTLNVLLGYFVTSIFLCNGALWACDVYVARSSDFYGAYEVGADRDLINAAGWLIEHPPADGQIAVCERYENMGALKTSRLGLRVTTMLTGKAIVSVPMKYLRAGDPRRNPNFLNWARSPDIGVKYVLYQPPVSPWRIFHFKVPWLQEAMTGEPAINNGAAWRLYEIPPTGDEALRISVHSIRDWPTRVPGLEPPDKTSRAQLSAPAATSIADQSR